VFGPWRFHGQACAEPRALRRGGIDGAQISCPVSGASQARSPQESVGSFAVLALVAGVLHVGFPARAHDTHADANPKNDWISDLKNSSGQRCCGNDDCRPVRVGGLIVSATGGIEVEIGGRLLPVLENSLVYEASPDGQAWVCPEMRPVFGFSYSIGGVRCLLLPPAM
jgi:hypothetical protein